MTAGIAPLCVVALILPALWNGYPIVFADSGTYLSQAMHHYLGWDRPVFYSLFMYPLHFGVTTWPVILVQSCLTVMTLDLTRRAFGLSSAWLLALTVFLTVATWMPWIVSEISPDLFTPLMVLLSGLLIFARRRFAGWQQIAMALLAGFMISTQQSSVLLALVLMSVMIPFQWFADGTRTGPPAHSVIKLLPLLAPGAAIVALVAVNTIGFGRVSLSPFGNVFVLARVIYDGPGMTALRLGCPDQGWRLCPYLDRFPASSDAFLWAGSSPILLAGGHKAVSAEADAIIRSAIAAEPGREFSALWNNTIEQLTRFASGDGLEPWPSQVGSWIHRDFPAQEGLAFDDSRQQLGELAVPWPLMQLHVAVAIIGIVGALVLVPIAWRRRHPATGFLLISLLTLPVSATVTGGLSGPHDRYQSRIVWLPAAMTFLSVPSLLQARRRAICTNRRNE
jgi:hypothetical protein